MKKILIGIILGILGTLGFLFIKDNPENTYIVKVKTRINSITNKSEPTGLANPASVFCEENKGTLEIKNETGGSIGICNFKDGSSCEERAYFRGECLPDNEKPKTEIVNPQEENTPEIQEPTVCTMEYAPICAKVQIQCIKAPCEPIEQTFSNKCMMEANKQASFLHEGECKTEEFKCPQLAPPSPTFCQSGTIEDGGLNQNGCQLPPICK